MSQASHASDIAFSTAFLTDKICGIYSGTFSESNSTYLPGINYANSLYQYAIPHPFQRPVLCEGYYVGATGNVPFGQRPSGSGDAANVYSDSQNIYILTLGNLGTITYKIIATWIDDYDTSNPLIVPQLNTTNNFPYFDTRNNYQKVLIEDVVTLNNPGVGNTGTYTIPHNLGYKPDFKIFFESLPNQVWPQISGGAADLWVYNGSAQYEILGVVDDNNLILSYDGLSSSAPTFRVWYRIYYDQ